MLSAAHSHKKPRQQQQINMRAKKKEKCRNPHKAQKSSRETNLSSYKEAEHKQGSKARWFPLILSYIFILADGEMNSFRSEGTNQSLCWLLRGKSKKMQRIVKINHGGNRHYWSFNLDHTHLPVRQNYMLIISYYIYYILQPALMRPFLANKITRMISGWLVALCLGYTDAQWL